MALPILLLILSSALLHATWNFMAKTIPGRAAFVWLLAAVISALMLPVAIAYLVIYGFEFTTVIVAALVLTSTIHLAYFLILQKGYSVADLSVVYPLARGSGPMFSTLGAVLFLGETVTLFSLLGLALIVAGVLLVSGLAKPGRSSQRLRDGVVYGLLTGLFIAAYTIWDGFSVKKLGVAPLVLEYFSHPFRVVALLPVARQRWPEIKGIWAAHRWKVLAISVMAPLGFVLFLYALKQAPVHYAAPAREVSIVFGVIFGAKLLTEENFRRRLVGSLLILGGIVLLST